MSVIGFRLRVMSIGDPSLGEELLWNVGDSVGGVLNEVLNSKGLWQESRGGASEKEAIVVINDQIRELEDAHNVVGDDESIESLVERASSDSKSNIKFKLELEGANLAEGA